MLDLDCKLGKTRVLYVCVRLTKLVRLTDQSEAAMEIGWRHRALRLGLVLRKRIAAIVRVCRVISSRSISYQWA